LRQEGFPPSEKQIKEISKILGLDPETLNKELRQFYEDRKKELRKRIERKQESA